MCCVPQGQTTQFFPRLQIPPQLTSSTSPQQCPPLLQSTTAQEWRERCVWPTEGTAPALDVWRSSTEASGAQCVMMLGTCWTLRWCAGSWAVAGCCLLLIARASERAPAPFGWTMWHVQEGRLLYPSVDIGALEPTTVTTKRMLEWSVKVKKNEWAFYHTFAHVQLALSIYINCLINHQLDIFMLMKL